MFDLEKLARFPQEPGVYLMKGDSGAVLYVGKAKNLRQRIKQYFAVGRDTRKMIPFLISQITDIETISTFSEKEALLLENTLIKRHKPKYNVLLKDDKSYISLMINHRHKWPMIKLVRTLGKPQKDALYFGPYTSAYAARCTLELMQKIFPLRQCSDRELLSRTRPCLLYGIKRCIAPCVGKCSPDEYRYIVKEATDFLKGRGESIIAELVQERDRASENLEFEKAADLQRTIRQIEEITGSAKTSVQAHITDCDVIGLYREGDHVLLSQLLFREGKLIGQVHYNFAKVAGEDSEIIESFLIQHYQNALHPPPEIHLPLPLETLSSLSELIKIKLTAPLRGEKKKLIKLAEKNAHLQFKQELNEQTLREERLLELEESLELSHAPMRIECFDTSNIAGSDPVACMVAFTNGEKDRKRTRLFKIRTGGDDYSAMREVLMRRYKKAKEEDDLPNLLIVDGGKGQLNIAVEVLKELNIASIDLIAVTKEAGRHDKGLTKERIFFPHREEPLSLKETSSLLFFLQQIRDEAHRVAIGFHRKRRSKRIIKSSLDGVPGIGPKKKNRLLSHFGSVKCLKEASLEEIMSVEGIAEKDAKSILNFFQSGSDRDHPHNQDA